MQEYDIYISYAKEDDYPESGAEHGWISIFQNCLKQILKQVLKRQPFFLTSSQDSLASEKLGKIEIFICIVSPAYLMSETCQQDLKNVLSVKNKKIFKVIKSSIDEEQEPLEIRTLSHYSFETITNNDGLSLAEQPMIGSPEFWTKMYDFANDISKELSDKTLPTEQGTQFVYLSETFSQNEKEKSQIRRELEKQGCIVLPNEKYPKDEAELENFVARNIEKCTMSIHLIGSAFGNPVLDAGSIIIETENKIISEYSSTILSQGHLAGTPVQFNRFIWIEPELKKNDERYKSYIENFLRNGESLEGAEVVQTPLEDFKFIVKSYLKSPASRQNFKKADKNKLYLIYDSVDSKEADELMRFFEHAGIELLKPMFNGDFTAIRRHHLTNLVNCSSTIILFGDVNEKWVQMKSLDLLKSPAFGREKPMDAKAIYFTGKKKFDKDFFSKNHIEVLEKRSEDIERNLAPFLERIKITVNG